MAMTSIMSTGSQCVAKAGSGVSAAFDNYWTSAGLQAESVVNCICRHDFSADFPTLGSAAKFLLGDTVSSLAAIQAIMFDMSGYSSRIEAEDIININRDTALRNLSILRDHKVQDFISGVTV